MMRRAGATFVARPLAHSAVAALRAPALRGGMDVARSRVATLPMIVPCAAPVAAQRFAAMYETPGRRDEEAFLRQYDPLDVLGLSRNTNNIKEVDSAYAKLRDEFGPKSKKPNPQKWERVEKSYKILKDYQSVYYSKQAFNDQNRRDMMLQIMPQGSSIWTQAKAMMMTAVMIIGFFGFLYVMFYPVIKMARAASRGSR